MLDLTGYSDEQLERLRDQVFAEMDRRLTIATAGEEIDRIVQTVNTAEGVQQGDPWQERPYGYPKGAEVVEGGVTYVSQVPNNVWRPGDTSNPVSGSLWKPKHAPAPDETGVLPWTPWEDVNTGDVRVYQGVAYRVRQAHKTLPNWPPDQTPALWERTTL